jgi:pilus assembly protein CpaE
MAGIVLAFPAEGFERTVAASLSGSDHSIRSMSDGGALGDLASIVNEMVASDPDVVTVGPSLPTIESLALVRELDRLHPDITVLLVETPSADLWKSALLAGARDVIDPTSDLLSIAESFDRALDLAKQRRNSRRVETSFAPAVEPKGRIATVVSPKGGSGKTVIATNLAVLLSRACPGEVVLVDLDLQFGDVASSLGLTPTYTMYTATQASGSESALLKAFLTPHASSSLLVLCAPEDPTEADDVKEGDAIRILQELSKLFSWVIVDTGAGLDDLTLAVAEVSSDLIFVTSTDVPSVRGIRKEAMIMDQLGIRAERHFVLNRSDAKVGLSPADISATTGLQIVAEVPSSRSVPTSVNIGVPIVDHEARNPAARGLAAFANRLVESDRDPSAAAKRKGRFRK